MALDEGTPDLQMDHEWTIYQGGMPGPVVSRTAPTPTPAGRDASAALPGQRAMRSRTRAWFREPGLSAFKMLPSF